MIVEMVLTTVKSRTLGPAEQRFAAALPERQRLSPLGGFWRTDVGPLNQCIEVWPYSDEAQRQQVLARQNAMADWPPLPDDIVIERESKVLTLAPFSPPVMPGQFGQCYEFRTYTYEPGSIPLVIENWTPIIGARAKLSPFIGAWYRQTPTFDEWTHVWAYRDAGQREHVRQAAVTAGIWPISVVEQRQGIEPKVVATKMENKLAIPAKFSPLQ